MKTLQDIEHKRYSQHGEDGVFEFLASTILEPNHYFIEIGCADGRENNSSALIERGYRGIAIDGDAQKIASYLHYAQQRGWMGRVLPVSCMIDASNVIDIFSHFGQIRPDIFSLDIDGIDYYVMMQLLAAGFKPRVVGVEYNAALLEEPLVVEYDPAFNRWKKHKSGLYYGTSVASWKYLFEQFNYQFVTVESSGINAFFVDPEAVNMQIISELQSEGYLQSEFYNQSRGCDAKGQFAMISSLPYQRCDTLLQACLKAREEN
jgi:hypothetical protein